MRRSSILVASAVYLSLLSGCSIRKMAINSMADSLASGGDVFASDEDPELIRAAVPFALKTYESLLAETPRHRGLLVATAAGFTQYGYAFVQRDAELIEDQDLERSLEIRRRARRLMVRGRDFALRALEVEHAGITDQLRSGRTDALDTLGDAAVPAMYWCGASWGGAIAVLKDDADLIGDLPVVEALLRRVIELAPGFDRGAAHAVMMSLEAGLAGGSLERAEEHFEAAVRFSAANSAAPFVTHAETIAVARQDRALFMSNLERALAIERDAEPALRLSNMLAQERARWLRGRADELFLE